MKTEKEVVDKKAETTAKDAKETKEPKEVKDVDTLTFEGCLRDFSKALISEVKKTLNCYKTTRTLWSMNIIFLQSSSDIDAFN